MMQLELLVDKLRLNPVKTSYIDTMQADNRGTEIGLALLHVFSKRDKAMPTALFVLTDGEVSRMEHNLL